MKKMENEMDNNKHEEYFKKINCPNCGNKIIIENWQDETDCFCSPECEYEYRTGNSGEEY